MLSKVNQDPLASNQPPSRARMQLKPATSSFKLRIDDYKCKTIASSRRFALQTQTLRICKETSRQRMKSSLLSAMTRSASRTSRKVTCRKSPSSRPSWSKLTSSQRASSPNDQKTQSCVTRAIPFPTSTRQKLRRWTPSSFLMSAPCLS
jgi:hypothetical protein